MTISAALMLETVLSTKLVDVVAPATTPSTAIAPRAPSEKTAFATMPAGTVSPTTPASLATSRLNPTESHIHVQVEQAPSLVTIMLPAGLVVAGWFIVNKTQANRERRKQLREAVGDLQESLSELEKVAISYHSAARLPALEREIVSKLGRFEKACSAIPRYVNSQRFWRACPPASVEVDARSIQQLRKAITLNHFADEHTGALDDQDELIQEIDLAATVVQERLEDVRIAALD